MRKLLNKIITYFVLRKQAKALGYTNKQAHMMAKQIVWK
jgi:prophage antirepressor-like protein